MNTLQFLLAVSLLNAAICNSRSEPALQFSSRSYAVSPNGVLGIQFQFANYRVPEDAGAVLIGIVRGDEGVLPVTADFATTDLSATNALDYVGMTNTLSF